MMRKMTVLGFVIAVALASPAFAQSFAGQWTATAKAQGGESSETLSVTRTGDGYSITGAPATPPPEGVVVGAGQDIMLEGNNFSYSRTISMGGNAIKITYKGVVSGDSFSGTVEVGGQTVPYTGVRIAAGK